MYVYILSTNSTWRWRLFNWYTRNTAKYRRVASCSCVRLCVCVRFASEKLLFTPPSPRPRNERKPFFTPYNTRIRTVRACVHTCGLNSSSSSTSLYIYHYVYDYGLLKVCVLPCAEKSRRLCDRFVFHSYTIYYIIYTYYYVYTRLYGRYTSCVQKYIIYYTYNIYVKFDYK